MAYDMDEPVECPLCMEPLEMDDLSFFPCTCGYQICRFCWHRIRTDENGLCPACRKPYSENPADFKPLSAEELQRIKAEKKQKDLQRKLKTSENRKHLANVRVVQKNLVFVVGLSPRLADPDVLKRHEYFGKFGKIHKVVINHTTQYAGAQVSGRGPSASAYVTYYRSDDALRAIAAVNNITIDNRTLKASLGTTKYCSHFMKNQPCPKTDCMYLHEIGDEAASFTKEAMQQGKHQEYEKKLHDQLYQQQQNQINRAKDRRSHQCQSVSQSSSSGSVPIPSGSQKGSASADSSPADASWPVLQTAKKGRGRRGKKRNAAGSGSNGSVPVSGSGSTGSGSQSPSVGAPPAGPTHSDDEGSAGSREVTNSDSDRSSPAPCQPAAEREDPVQLGPEPEPVSGSEPPSVSGSPPPPPPPVPSDQQAGEQGTAAAPVSVRSPPGLCLPDLTAAVPEPGSEPALPLCLPHSAADDDLDFDPFEETKKGLSVLLEQEREISQQRRHTVQIQPQQPRPAGPLHTQPPPAPAPALATYSLSTGTAAAAAAARTRLPPPGFNGLTGGPAAALGALGFPPPPPPPPQQQQQQPPPITSDMSGSKMLSFLNGGAGVAGLNGLSRLPPGRAAPLSPPNGLMSDLSNLMLHGQTKLPPPPPPPTVQDQLKDWQGLKKHFPNINISFGGGQPSGRFLAPGGSALSSHNAPPPPPPSLGRFRNQLPVQQKPPNPGWSSAGSDWTAMDPAIVSSGQVSDPRAESPPHWLRSLEQLTETGPMYPPAPPGPLAGPALWTSTPPPGFNPNLRRTAENL